MLCADSKAAWISSSRSPALMPLTLPDSHTQFDPSCGSSHAFGATTATLAAIRSGAVRLA